MQAPQYGRTGKRRKAPMVPAPVADTLLAQHGHVCSHQPRDKRRSRNDTRWHDWALCGNARRTEDLPLFKFGVWANQAATVGNNGKRIGKHTRTSPAGLRHA